MIALGADSLVSIFHMDTPNNINPKRTMYVIPLWLENVSENFKNVFEAIYNILV